MLEQSITHSHKAADREQLVCQSWCSRQVSSRVYPWRRGLPQTPLAARLFLCCWPLPHGVALSHAAGLRLLLLLTRIYNIQNVNIG